MNLKYCLNHCASTLIVLASTTTAFASAPMATAENPGYYRIHLGAFEVTAISDGTAGLPMDQLLTHIKPEELKKTLAYNHLTNPVEASFNSFLINTGDKLVLVDTGAGKLFGPTLGRMLSNLKAAGYHPEQVDAVLITHMHPDHVGGLVTDGKIIFTNATVYADKAEADFWLSPENMAKAPEANKGFFQGAMASINPYIKAGRLKMLTENTEIVTGVKSLATHGHTAGHTTYVVESKGQKLALIGDLVHFVQGQFEKPSICIQFDTDQKAAEAQRKSAFAEAASEGYLIGAAHISFPGIGHVQTNKKAFEFIPIAYSR